MKLREVMLLNGILYNSEAWHGVTKEDVKTLEAIDESLIRALLKAHAKTAREFLYLEVGATPIKWIISQRRVNYLKHIIQKEDDELVKKVYIAQRDDPTSGDFVKLVEKDMEDLNVTYEQVASMDKIKLKKTLKSNATNAAFQELKEKLKKHKSVKHMKYEHFEIQSYLQSKILHPEEAHVVTALRSQCVKNVRSNFRKMYNDRLNCPLKCNIEVVSIDTQEHLLQCKKLSIENPLKLSIESVFADVVQQEQIGQLVYKIIKQRSRLLEEIMGGNP